MCFYRHFEDAKGNPPIGNIEFDDELGAVVDAFQEMPDEEQFESMQGESDDHG